MVGSSHIILAIAICIGTIPIVHSVLQSERIIEETSNQLLESDGKRVGDCDAILVSSPGEVNRNSVQ